jgi:hypothetical protein
MGSRFDELAKAMAEGMSRRDALRVVGGGIAAALMGSLGIGRAWSAPGDGKGQGCGLLCTQAGAVPGTAAHSRCSEACEACRTTGGTANIGTGGSVSCTCPSPRFACPSNTSPTVCCANASSCVAGTCAASTCPSTDAFTCPGGVAGAAHTCGTGGSCYCYRSAEGAALCGQPVFCSACTVVCTTSQECVSRYGAGAFCVPAGSICCGSVAVCGGNGTATGTCALPCV